MDELGEIETVARIVASDEVLDWRRSPSAPAVENRHSLWGDVQVADLGRPSESASVVELATPAYHAPCERLTVQREGATLLASPS